MAYSNVTPPTLPAYDSETYGFYLLVFNYELGSEDWHMVHLIYSAWRFHYEEGLGVTNTGNTFIRTYSDGTWTEELQNPETLALNPGISGNMYKRIYTNANIFNGDEIWLAADTVTPVEEEPVPEPEPEEPKKFPFKQWMGMYLLGVCSPRRAFPQREPIGYPTDCLTFASAEPFTISVYNNTKNWDDTLYYSTDAFANDDNEWDGTEISSAEHNGEHRIYMRGKGNTVITGSDYNDRRWVLDGNNIKCIGNIENLLCYETVMRGEHPIMGEKCYRHMFWECTGLTQAPELPATTLEMYCYEGMFSHCISLTSAPELPATTLATGCYQSMFGQCASLTSVPELPATTLATECYYLMFYWCTSLKLDILESIQYPTIYRIPSSGNGVSATRALNSMFTETGGTFTGTPEINTTYYLHKDNSIV